MCVASILMCVAFLPLQVVVARAEERPSIYVVVERKKVQVDRTEIRGNQTKAFVAVVVFCVSAIMR